MIRGSRRVVWWVAAVLVTVVQQRALSQRATGSVIHRVILPLAQMQHRVWTERDGLPIEPLYTPQRTSDGYLWIGTNNAVLRFDGVRFVRMDSTNTPALRSRAPGLFLLLLLDRDGWLWISRPDGMLVRYRDGIFQPVAVVDADARASQLVQDGTGLLWGMAQNLFVLRGTRVETPPLPAAVDPTDITRVAPDTGNGVWIGTTRGELWNLTPTGARRLDTSKLDATPTSGGADRAIRPMLQTDDGRLWILTDAIHSLAGGQWSTPMAGTPPHAFTGIRATTMRNGSVVFVTRGDGLIRWTDGVVEQYDVSDGLSGAAAESAVEDDDQNLWIATDAGLDRLRPSPFAVLDRRDGFPFESPRSLLIGDDGALWVVRGGTLQLFRITRGIVDGVPGPVDVREIKLRGGRSEMLAPARGGGIWYYARDGHVGRYRNGVETTLAAPGMPRGRPTTAYEDSTGGLWLSYATHEFGVVRAGRYTPIAMPRGTGRVSSITPAGRESVWATVEDADIDMLVKFARDRVETWVNSPGPRHTFFGGLAVEGSDTVWVTAGGVVVRVANGRATTVLVPDIARIGIGNSNALQVANGYLWFGGEAGIGRIALAGMHRAADGAAPPPHAEIFTALDGIATPKLGPMNPRPSYQGSDGRIWFSTPSGVAVVDPSSLRADTTPPPVHIEEIVAAGHLFASAAHLDLAPNPERIDIHFTAADLRVPERTHIEYRLDGVNETWVDAASARMATYTQLRPGTYRFHVRARTEGGAVGPDVSMAMSVLPAWYQTWWFRGLLVAAAAAAVALLIQAVSRARARAHTERIRQRFEAEINERTRMARELHDTLLQGFQGVTLQLHAVRRTVIGSPRDAESTLSRILELADLSLRDARAMVWDMRAPELDVLDLHAALAAASTAAAASGEIACDCRIEGKIRRLSPAVEMAVLRIAKEAIANAARHSAASAIGVLLSYETNAIRLTVRDNGRGLDPDAMTGAATRGHWGLAGMQERATQIAATLEITSIDGGGTSVTLVAPAPQRPLYSSRASRSSVHSPS